MSPDDQAAAAAPSLVDSLKTYIEDLPEDERADALHGVFYGFYTRVAIIDRTTYELAAWAKNEAGQLANVPEPLKEALRDNALFVGQELFASRVRAMRAMGYVSSAWPSCSTDRHRRGRSPSSARSPSTRSRAGCAATGSPTPASTPTCPTTRRHTTPTPPDGPLE